MYVNEIGRDVARRPLSIVVPVYGDWGSLARCLESLERYSAPFDTVMIVNDSGPQADELEASIQPFLERNAQFEYSRNDENLGFVGTCNRAVLELDSTGNDVVLLNSDAEITQHSLDEMLAVLDISERHGLVCPRSDNATIATVPWRRHASTLHDVGRRERAARIFSEIAPVIPRYYVAPVVVGFCMLIRRNLIDNYGLFDPIFGAGYNEENDMSLRVNELGYSSVIANRALVFHLGSASFGEQSSLHESTNAAVLRTRYPFYLQAVADFMARGYAAADQFADLIVDPSPSRRVLIDLYHVSHLMNGSTKNALSFLEYLAGLDLGNSVHITIAAQPSTIEFFKLESFGFDVKPWETIDGVFDLGIALAPVITPQQLEMMNLTCARWLLCHLDVIATRSLRLATADPTRRLAVRDSLIHADRVVTISQSTVDDTIAFFSESTRLAQSNFVVIPQGSTRGAIRENTLPHHAADHGASVVLDKLVGTTYVLVIGNFYPHKQVRRALEALSDLGVTIVAFDSATGPISRARMPRNIVSLGSGFLSDDEMDILYREASVVVFPSAYEGFGLPIPDSLDQGTPVIVFDTQVARELIRDLDAAAATVLFTRFADLPSLVTAAIDDETLKTNAQAHAGSVRNIVEFNSGIWAEAESLLSADLDVSRLFARYEELVTSLGYARGASLSVLGSEVISLRGELDSVLASGSFRLGHVIARAASPFARVLRRVRSSVRP